MTMAGRGKRALRIFLPLLVLGAASPTELAPMKAWIKLESDEAGHPHFVAYVQADHAFEGRFELVGERRGGGGTSVVTQSGSIRTAAGQAARLSQMSFGDLAAVPHYALHLRVFAGDKLAASAELVK